MKRKDNLFTKICTLENLIIADLKARKGKLKTYGVKKHDLNAFHNLEALREQLISGKYKTSLYTTFKIYEPKEREIFRLPYYPDRIVHHAIMNIMEPIWVSIFTKNTYSCIKNRGIHKAVNDIKYALAHDIQGTQYCLKLDIRKYYPSIDHDILKLIIRKKIKDLRLLNLLDEIIDSAKGVPIGNYLSLFFANLYLTYFDHWIKETMKIKYYYRYCDDIVILGENKELLHLLFISIEEYLNTNLKLKIKTNWLIYPIEIRGIDFIGYVFRHRFTRLRKNIKRNLCKKVIRESYITHNYSKRLYDIGSYFGWLKYCNSTNLKYKLNNNYYNETVFRILSIPRYIYPLY